MNHICSKTGESDQGPGPNNVTVRNARINEDLTTRPTGCHQAVAMPAYRTFVLYAGGETSPRDLRFYSQCTLLPMHQAALDGADGGLSPVADAHLIQDATYMDAHGFLGNT